jgi:ATP-dependent DNA helicase RecG
MDVITKSNDGFVISEKDLELRGSGEFFGTKQHGIPEFKIANLFTDIEMLKQVQAIVMEILNNDPELTKPENACLQKMIENKFKDRIEI